MYTPKNRNRHTDFVVKEEAQLFDFIFQKIGSMSKTAIKGILSKGQISVNDKIITQYNHILNVGDKVRVDFSKAGTGLKSTKLSVIYEDEFIIVVNKAEGLLSVATEKREDNTAFRIVMNHLKKQNKFNKLYIVHRLDRETSGVLLFAKTKETQEILQNNWQTAVHSKIYYALVEGVMEQPKGSIHTWLTEEPKSKRVFSSDTDNGGQESLTDYKVVKQYKNYALLEINLHTGRKNQIRVHMQTIGHPIVGDKKYGGLASPIGRVGLHAAKLVIHHPITRKELTFEVPLPEKFVNFKG